jgi:hypothetical protein
MEEIRIKQITERDFDRVVEMAGGKRLLEEGSADYVANEAVIELKLLEEEGLEKEARRTKLANLFRSRQPGRPVVVVDPSALNAEGQREFYNIVEGPIKTHVKKAAKQLEKTAAAIKPEATRVLVIANIGYTALSPDEFKAVCVRRVQNDTTKIDWLVCAGIYYYSDGFDSWILARFEDVPVNLDRAFPSRHKLLEKWNEFLNEAMAEHLRHGPLETGKHPVIDLAFEQEGVRFVKPAPPLPRSDFWPGGSAPRRNSRANDPPRPVAKSFPALREEDWRKFKLVLPRAKVLQESYAEWQKVQCREEKDLHEPRHPFVPMRVEYEAFANLAQKPASQWEFRDLGEFANDLLNAKIREVLQTVKDAASVKIVPVEYLHVAVEEIGRDKANDICTIRHICEVPGFEKNEILFQNIEAYLEEGVCLAACYAVKRGVTAVVYRKV